MNLVKRSLYFCIGVLLLLIGLQGMQSLWQTSRLSTAIENVAASGVMADRAHTLWSRMLAAEQAFRQATSFVDAAGADDLRKSFNAQAQALRAAVAALPAGGAQEDAAGVAAEVETWLGMAAAHVSADGVTALPAFHLLDEARNKLENSLRQLVARSAETTQATVAQSRALERGVFVWTLVELGIAVALGLALGWFALRSLHRQLGADASEVARIANAVADGDLTIRIESAGVPEGSVMAATARMQHSLMETVARVRSISGQLFNGANEIADGNVSLSRLAEQQAGAIERTASTMEQLGATVRNNAAHAAQASQIAEQASSVATQGGQVVGRAVDTMKAINDSSRQISDIIGVIDGIAFQTNILALNAAVEAARAGEQGRGFAVVAGEVRVLARRSADAAKQIKSIIHNSVQCVEQGSALVDQAGSTMQEVVTAIQRVTAVSQQIRTASDEQSTAVGEVGTTVQDLDRTTQQNAALAGQSAQAAQRLREQGQDLVNAVSFFKLREVT
jgi:methyl-accepting chemotaxis protein